MHVKVIFNLISIFFAFLGSYLSLRSILISQIKIKLSSHIFSYSQWKNIPWYDRLTFRAFGITEQKKWALFMAIPLQVDKELIDRLFSYSEPFRALIYYLLAFTIQIIAIFV